MKFYDKATAPTIADTPVLRVWCPIGSNLVLDFADSDGFPFQLGFGHRSSVAGIDNDATYTGFAANDSAVNVIYCRDAIQPQP